MLGTVTKNREQALEALRRIKAAGYDGIELNRFMIHPSSLMVRMLTKAAGMPTGNGGRMNWHELLETSGLTVISLHADLGSLEKETDTVIQEAQSFHTDTVVITGMYRFDYSDAENVKDLAKRLNQCGEYLKKNGIRLLYHNHNVELLRCNSDMRAYEILLEETDPENVNFEFDSYWFTDGGANAKEWMKKLGKRMKLWHINDRGSRSSGASITPILKADSMELGTGNMDLDGLKEIAIDNGVDAIILESHKNWINKDPLQSIEVSAKWLNNRF